MTSDVIRGFDRDTGWLATAVLGTVIFAALTLAVQEHHPMKVNPSEEAMQAGSELSRYTNIAAAPTPVFAFTPESSPLGEVANPDSSASTLRQDSARSIGPETRNVRNRSSVASRSIDVKRRLIQLWHQSLTKSEKSRSWTSFSNLNRGVSKKAAYTPETNR